MFSFTKLAAVLPLVTRCAADTFTVSNGQIYTPGFVVVNAPQPGTPMGGDDLHISLDVTANGKFGLPPYGDDSPSRINDISVFLYSYTTGRNFTLAHPDEDEDDDSGAIGDMMAQEDGSTVKHLNWVWPDCLVGDGEPSDSDSDRGIYNISIRQNFRLNGDDHYTIFDLPIAVTNSIEKDDDRPSCDDLDNDLMSPEDIDAASANDVGVLFAPGDSTEVEATFEDGAAGALGLGAGARWVCLVALAGAALL